MRIFTHLAWNYKREIKLVTTAIFCTLFLFAVNAQDTTSIEQSYFDLSLEDLSKVQVTTASKFPETRSKSTSNVFLITSADLKRIGARSYYDALTLIPGFSVYTERSLGMGTPLRGIYTAGSPGVLILLNGREINPPRIGGASNQFQDNIPIESIKQIEIIKGPVSALYGANAFYGVINIITKNPDGIDGLELSVSTELETENNVGQQYNLMYGKRFTEQVGFMVNLNLLDHSGPKVRAGPDAFGRTDYISAGREILNLYSELEIRSLYLRGGYYERTTDGGYGTINIIEHQTERKTWGGTFEAEWTSDLTKDLHLKVIASLDHVKTDNYYVGFVPGTVPEGSPYLPWNSTGVIANPLINETCFGEDIQLTYQGWKNHIIVGGISHRYESQHDPKYNTNLRDPGSPVKDVSDKFNWMESAHRNIYSSYLQDIWSIGNNLRLSSGIRFDNFSDFGFTVNPRVGLAWDISEKFDSKISYGTGFRAPTFSNQYIKNNPSRVANPDLGPEKAKSFETSIGYKLNSRLNGRATYYHTEYDELIADALEGRSYANVGEARVDGFELEGQYMFKNKGNIGAYYAFNHSRLGSGDDTPNVPNSTIGGNLNLPLGKRMDWNTNMYWQGKTQREEGDSREAMPDRTIVNTTLLLRKIWKSLELRFSVFNLFDEEYAYPAPPNTYPNDYKATGRSFVINAKYVF